MASVKQIGFGSGGDAAETDVLLRLLQVPRPNLSFGGAWNGRTMHEAGQYILSVKYLADVHLVKLV